MTQLHALLVGPLAAPVFRSEDAPHTPWPAAHPQSRSVGGDAPDLVLAVDSGYDRCLERGWLVHILVGDLDSLSGAGLATAVARGVEVVRLPVDKDVSDLDVALDVAVKRGATSITAVGFLGGRLDHQLAVLGASAAAPVRGLVLLGPSVDAGQPPSSDVVCIATAGTAVSVDPNKTFSVMALGANAVVSVTGAKWPLTNHELHALSALGLSNESESEGATVSCHGGVVAVVVPPSVAERAST